MICNIP